MRTLREQSTVNTQFSKNQDLKCVKLQLCSSSLPPATPKRNNDSFYMKIMKRSKGLTIKKTLFIMKTAKRIEGLHLNQEID